jgi:hypothetical protein
MTELEQASNDLAKAYWLLKRAGFIRGYDEDESLQECDHLVRLADEAMRTINRQVVRPAPSAGKDAKA